MGIWHSWPVNVGGHEHEHWHSVVFKIRVPLFWQVVNEHASNGVSHLVPRSIKRFIHCFDQSTRFLPVYPHGHWHRWALFSIEHWPPLKQLSRRQWATLQSDPEKEIKHSIVVFSASHYLWILSDRHRQIIHCLNLNKCHHWHMDCCYKYRMVYHIFCLNSSLRTLLFIQLCLTSKSWFAYTLISRLILILTYSLYAWIRSTCSNQFTTKEQPVHRYSSSSLDQAYWIP